MKSELELWCDRICSKPNVELWKLEDDGKGNELFQLKEKYGDGKPYYFYTDPYYYIWSNDKMIDVIKDYRMAYAIYKERVREYNETQG